MNVVDSSATSPHTFYRKHIEQQIRIKILIKGLQGLINFKRCKCVIEFDFAAIQVPLASSSFFLIFLFSIFEFFCLAW